MAIVAVILAGCAAGGETSTVSEAYEAKEARTGSNIPSREKRAPTTPEERARARAEAEAIRDSQIRTGGPGTR